nr:uncharacterized protein LOC110122451 [Odocoileus virginianus texanus]
MSTDTIDAGALPVSYIFTDFFGHRVEALPTLSGQLVSEFVVVTVSPGASVPPELCRAPRSESGEQGLQARVRPEGGGHSASQQPFRSRRSGPLRMLIRYQTAWKAGYYSNIIRDHPGFAGGMVLTLILLGANDRNSSQTNWLKDLNLNFLEKLHGERLGSHLLAEAWGLAPVRPPLWAEFPLDRPGAPLQLLTLQGKGTPLAAP